MQNTPVPRGQPTMLSAEENKMVEVAIAVMMEKREGGPVLVRLPGGTAALITYRYNHGKYDVVITDPKFAAVEYPHISLEGGRLSPHSLKLNTQTTVYTPPDGQETTAGMFTSDPWPICANIIDDVFWKTLYTVSTAKLSTDEFTRFAEAGHIYHIVRPTHEDANATFPFHPKINRRLEFALDKVCNDGATAYVVPYSEPSSNVFAFVGFSRNGDTINALCVTVLKKARLLIDQTFIFPDDFRHRFPHLNFTSDTLTVAEKDALFLQPVFSHYGDTVAQLVQQHHIPRLLALAMGSHHRLGKNAALLLMRSDAMELIAREVWGMWGGV